MVPKQQIFTASGTFTPPPGMITQGGHCHVFLVGGGGAGGSYTAETSYSSEAGEGGCGGQVIDRLLVGIVTPQQVLIGAGGNNSTYNGGSYGAGGSSKFGVLTASGGPNGGSYYLGVSVENLPEKLTKHGVYINGNYNNFSTLRRTAGQGRNGYGAGGRVNRHWTPPTNSGCGGASTDNDYRRQGAAGICIVTWWEAAE